MSLQDAYKPNMKRAVKLFGESTGAMGVSTNEIVRGVKKAARVAMPMAKKAVKKMMTPTDSSGYDRVGNQLIKRKVIKIK